MFSEPAFIWQTPVPVRFRLHDGNAPLAEIPSPRLPPQQAPYPEDVVTHTLASFVNKYGSRISLVLISRTVNLSYGSPQWQWSEPSAKMSTPRKQWSETALKRRVPHQHTRQ